MSMHNTLNCLRLIHVPILWIVTTYDTKRAQFEKKKECPIPSL